MELSLTPNSRYLCIYVSALFLQQYYYRSCGTSTSTDIFSSTAIVQQACYVLWLVIRTRYEGGRKLRHLFDRS